ncbi:DUF1294 domain-containing protein [Erythrobacteraceae bacterium WH01K]|nr:DUF1294 domain-containing protein [Erythrobacteraceae bacterium WH01K]
MLEYLTYYLIAINFAAFALFAYDKQQAENGGWRVRNDTLILMATLGGIIGAFAGRAVFRHKIRTPGFAGSLLAGFGTGAFLAAGAYFLLPGYLMPRSAKETARLEAVMASRHFSGCNAVRAAGAAPLRYGEPGYRSDMDGDGDGVACEPRY